MGAINQTTGEAAPFPSPTQKWHDNTYPSLSPTRPELSAQGKTIAITGGGTGIGAETARQFAAAGASRIGLFGRREQPLLDTKVEIEKSFAGIEVFIASTDVASKESLESSFAKFLGDSKIDVVISGAGVTGPLDSAQDVDGQEFIQAVNTNLLGALYTAQAFAKYAAKGAVAVNVSSSAAHVNFGTGFASYNTAKIGAVRIWDSLAAANPELTVFHIQPGIIDTDMNKQAGGTKAVGFEDHVSLPATFSVWLASPEAHFLNRKFLWANWDVDELKARAEEIRNGPMFDLTLVGWPFEASNNYAAPWKAAR
ncbi:NAD(P)-binding domain protein [Akanthomyces lecanii RCEF 1005]|uniref:NAD(P)-binding domain protein n=1 Tax=Akanthomyces lecanii RCEF 1005 TaxID=1081108 RepID=A0A162JNY7_CORDF|nr:NAD(P)-binding domain protein [Akanthomyces lecanii RCEF 1005]